MLLGALVMASAVIGLFFLRFWRDTHDRLFLIFSFAFWVLGADWFALGLVTDHEDARTPLYVVRLIGFVLLVAIADKNRAARRRPPAVLEPRRRAG